MKKCAILLLATTLAAGAADLPLKVSLLERDILWIRASTMPDDFAEQLHSAQPTNKISGIVLDLRFGDGTSGAAKDYFSTNQSQLVILVGRETRGAALTLARQLRGAGAGILIGSTNVSGNLSPDVLVAADVDEEKQFWENPYFQAATNAATGTNSLLQLVDHTSEAELVRKRVKDGEEDGPSTPTPRAPLTHPVIHDPALARAVDLLKALAILSPARG